MSFTRRCALWEHRASIAEREMSLTKCGCFQLTSEACYKYSNGAHCAPLHSGTQTDVIVNSDSTWIYFRSVREPGSITEWSSPMFSYLIITIFVTVVAGMNFSDVSHIFWEGTIVLYSVEPPLTDWVTDLQRDDHTNSISRPNKISMVTSSSTRAFCSSGTVSPVLLTNKQTYCP